MTVFDNRSPWTTCDAWSHPAAPLLDARRLAALPHPGRTLLVCKIREKAAASARRANLAAGEILCADPVVVLPKKDPANRRGGRLRHYVFDWSDPAAPSIALTIGPSSLANHSDRPNAEFLPDIGNGVIVLRARRAIPVGREITVSYG